MKSDYIEIENKTIFIRSTSLEKLRNIDVIVFDCDGVLLDVSNSYQKAVSETTIRLIEAFTGTSLPSSIFDKPLNFAYKRTGGFNNDWNLTYALVMRILAELNEKDRKSLNIICKSSLQYDDPYQRFKYIQDNSSNPNLTQNGLRNKLLTFAQTLDSNGVITVDNKLLSTVGGYVKEALNPQGPVGKSMISTLFEELMSGIKLFEETFRISAKFTKKTKGLVENEKIIINAETWDEFSSLLGGNRFGIASGSLQNTAYHVLGDTIQLVPSEAQMWHEQVDKAEKSSGKDLHKPNPYSLIKATEIYEPFKYVLYIGDSIADFLTASRAKMNDPRYLFAGVYQNVEPNNHIKKEFIHLGSDLIIPSVNELPQILRNIRTR